MRFRTRIKDKVTLKLTMPAYNVIHNGICEEIISKCSRPKERDLETTAKMNVKVLILLENIIA